MSTLGLTAEEPVRYLTHAEVEALGIDPASTALCRIPAKGYPAFQFIGSEVRPEVAVVNTLLGVHSTEWWFTPNFWLDNEPPVLYAGKGYFFGQLLYEVAQMATRR